MNWLFSVRKKEALQTKIHEHNQSSSENVKKQKEETTLSGMAKANGIVGKHVLERGL